MLDIGLGEGILIVVIALLVFGPDRLPKVASDAARTLRQIRSMATAARRDLADAAGLDEQGELTGTLRDIRDLDPRRVLMPLDEPAGEVQGRSPRSPAGGRSGSGSSGAAAGAGGAPAATAAGGAAAGSSGAAAGAAAGDRAEPGEAPAGLPGERGSGSRTQPGPGPGPLADPDWS